MNDQIFCQIFGNIVCGNVKPASTALDWWFIDVPMDAIAKICEVFTDQFLLDLHKRFRLPAITCFVLRHKQPSTLATWILEASCHIQDPDNEMGGGQVAYKGVTKLYNVHLNVIDFLLASWVQVAYKGVTKLYNVHLNIIDFLLGAIHHDCLSGCFLGAYERHCGCDNKVRRILVPEYQIPNVLCWEFDSN